MTTSHSQCLFKDSTDIRGIDARTPIDAYCDIQLECPAGNDPDPTDSKFIQSAKVRGVRPCGSFSLQTTSY